MESNPVTHQVQLSSNWPMRWLPLAWFSLAFIALVLGVLAALIRDDPMAWLMECMRVSSPGTVGIILHEIGMLFAVAILLLGLRSQGNPFRLLGLHGRLSWQMVNYAVLSAIVVFLVWPVLQLGIEALGIPFQWWREGLTLKTTNDWVWMIIAAGFLSPILEEVLFRGYLLNALLTHLPNRTIAILLATAIFTSIHVLFGPGTLILIFFWTFVPTWLVLRFKSLYPAILMHILNNLLAYIVVPLMGW
ncbi:MAG: CPBP family intramembrane glutamic endopeptidase [Chloroflexota bacterium]